MNINVDIGIPKLDWEVIKVEKPKEVEHDPVCPHCGQEIPHLNAHCWQVKGVILKEDGRIGVFSCPNCNKLLGVASVAWGKG